MDEQNHRQRQQLSGSGRTYPGLERLIIAALADPSFAAELIADPMIALAHAAPAVQLSPVERDLAISITGACDIHDFAARLYAKIQQEHARDAG